MNNQRQNGTPGINRININEKYELHYWSKKLGISQDELVKAVKIAGTAVTEVKKYLKQD